MNYYVHGIDQTFCFPLEPGCHVLGRGEGAAIRIEDPSVSTRHAEVELKVDGSVTIRDLESTNGTFIGDEKVSQVRVEIGQEVTFGSVRLKIDDEPVNVSVPRPEVPVQPQPSWMEDGEPACLFHPGVYAVYSCTQCGHALCAQCIRKVGLKGSRPKLFCTHCPGTCVPIEGLARKTRAPSRFQRIVRSVREFFQD